MRSVLKGAAPVIHQAMPGLKIQHYINVKAPTQVFRLVLVFYGRQPRQNTNINRDLFDLKTIVTSTSIHRPQQFTQLHHGSAINSPTMALSLCMHSGYKLYFCNGHATEITTPTGSSLAMIEINSASHYNNNSNRDGSTTNRSLFSWYFIGWLG